MNKKHKEYNFHYCINLNLFQVINNNIYYFYYHFEFNILFDYYYL